MNRRYGFPCLVCLMVFLAGDALAQSQVTLTPSKDNSMYEESGSLSNGAGDYLFVGNTSTGNARRALIAFDVSDALPADAEVQGVELVVRVSNAPVGTPSTEITLHRVTREWGEGASDAGEPGGMGAAAASGDATWTHAMFDDDTWQSNGGDFVGAVSASTSLGAAGSTYTVESTGTLVSDVQSWLDDPSSNFGWILIGDESSTQTARRLDSRDHPTEANHPQLTIHYSTTTAAEHPGLPGSFVLEGNHPNPFSRSTIVRYELDRAQETSLDVYDVTGRPVQTIPRRMQKAGPHEVEIAGSDLASGLYIYCLSTSSSRACRTFTVVR